MISVREEADWVLDEFGGVDLGDKRRTDRLLDNEALSHQALLSGHVQASWERLVAWGAAGERVVLAIQDTTELDFSGHQATSGLGQIGNRYGRGLLAHSTLACTTSGVPLGLLGQAVWARPAPSGLSKAQRKRRPIEEKESAKWLAGLAAVVEGRAQWVTPKVMSTSTSARPGRPGWNCWCGPPRTG